MNKFLTLLGRVCSKVQRIIGYKDPIILHRYKQYEDEIEGERETIAMLKAAMNMNAYKAYANTVFDTGKKSELFADYKKHNITISDEHTRLIAFYLPQFYTFPENDEWWGKGFTEWTNVTKAVPQFAGHYQPHLPYDSTFYDLTNISVQRTQVALAKNYGIYGFCFHYYWFNGKRLLEKPLDNYLGEKSLDLPFCINYANENWTRRWDGSEDQILMKQEHSDENDLACIADICRYVRDDRYIKVNGKPMIIIYNSTVFPDAARTLELWRGYCRDNGIGEIHLVCAQTFRNKDPMIHGFDDAVEFPPHFSNLQAKLIPSDEVLQVEGKDDFHIFDAEDFIVNKRHHADEPEHIYKTVFPGWDNTARRGENGIVYPMTPSLYKKWLLDVMKYTDEKREPGDRFVFINAWNEWAEGAHLEPDRKFGYGYLQATAEAVIESMDLITVVAPAYNHEKFIKSSLKSVFDQSYPNIELIIIDDCSTDGTVSVIDKIMNDDEFIGRFNAVKFIKHTENMGAEHSINEGIKMSTGKFIAIINTDDLYENNRLTDMVNAVSGRNSGFAFSAYHTINDDGDSYDHEDFDSIREILGQISSAKDSAERAEIFNTAILNLNLALSTGNMFFTRELYDNLDGFNNYAYVHDWDFLLRATMVCQPIYVDTTRYLYRIHSANTFTKLEQQELERDLQTAAVLRNIRKIVAEDRHLNDFINKKQVAEMLTFE